MKLSFPLYGRNQTGGPVEWLIVGLGNPGKKYALTRHNVGFHIVERLAEQEGLLFDETRNKALLARGKVAGQSVALVRPQTFMNLSGEAVGAIARFYKIPPPQILVIYDDLDLQTAQLRLRSKGGAGGHKGMTSIINHLSSRDFPRIRVGIGRPSGPMPVEAYVLQKFSSAEQTDIEQTYQNAIDAILIWLTEGIDSAMNRFNERRSQSNNV